MAFTWMNDDLNAGLAKANEAVSTASNGIGIAGAGASAMRGDAASMRGQARLVNSQAGAVNQTADALASLVPQLDPYKEKLSNYGDELSALALSLQTRADDVFGQGGALVNLDPTKGGLSAEYMGIYDLLSPDRYVSQAASDTQAAFDNAAAQNERALARRGVSAGSGASAALAQQLTRMKAVALAAAKTKARQMGIDEKGKWLQSMTSAANTLYNMGNQTESEALAAKGAAGDMAKGAASVVGQQGTLLNEAGGLRVNAGQLFANAASIFGSAANVEGGAANLELSALKNLQGAYQNAAQYYLSGIGLASRQGGGGGGGVTSTPAEEDDWFNWKGTGHSETWNKNHNPNFEDLIAVGE